jgi:glucose/arabinose dehydrogenase
MRLVNVYLILLLFSLSVNPVQAQSYPAGFSQTLVAEGITGPTVVTPTPDGRLFVCQQNGTMRVVKNGTLLPTPFLTVTVDPSGERGLIGLTVDPNFATNQYLYVYYTVPTSGTVTVHNRVSRFTANGDVVLASSELILLELDPLSGATNHNGGSLAFRPDGKLYIAVGDNANTSHPQTLTNHHGKVLRLNSDGSTPLDNPFPSGNAAQRRIWAYGLRNPYTLAVQPGTGRLFVNDVGQSAFEEINDASTGGLNFGWPAAEGNSSNPAFTNPVYAYPHGSGDGRGCAITGGTFYNPAMLTYPASFSGTYFFQDYCNGWINVLDLSVIPAVRSSFATGTSGQALSITLAPDGYLYFASLAAGALYKINYLGDCQTVQTGNWHNTATWSCGRIPTTTDQATVRHAVTIQTPQTANARQIRYESSGRIIYQANGKLRLGL